MTVWVRRMKIGDDQSILLLLGLVSIRIGRVVAITNRSCDVRHAVSGLESALLDKAGGSLDCTYDIGVSKIGKKTFMGDQVGGNLLWQCLPPAVQNNAMTRIGRDDLLKPKSICARSTISRASKNSTSKARTSLSESLFSTCLLGNLHTEK